jgi:hypothetical protein
MNPIILLVIGAVGLAGCIVLLLLGMNMLREERAGKDGRAPGSTVGTPAEANTAAPEPAKTAGGTGPLAGVSARLTGGGARGSAHEVLRVLRDNLTGRLLLEIAGKRYASLDEVGEGEMRQALLMTLHDLETFAGGAPAALNVPAQQTSELAGAASVPAVPTRAAKPAAEKATDEYRPLPPPTMNPFKQMAVLREMAKNPPPPPKTITEQIDEVLQARISGTPMIHRGLHVKPGPRGDAVFEADGQSYLSVDELPDVEVRDVIRAAVAEWEAKR